MTNERDLSEFERSLLNILQENFPLSERPFQVLADELETSPRDVRETVADLKNRNIIRRIGPVYDVKANGLVSTLLAGQLPSDNIPRSKEVFEDYPGITHAYIRPCKLNLVYRSRAEPG